ncbi:hypothetical protein RDWZM_008583 [Blomia tropicalis]|uniref:Septin-type G domain-containing protein n=1 Tax=Blomia tropicalis TaxID=40697 RepID=A0A9Q0M1M0_BLOTA|nr:hypothetical protein RDWZM_008583 [Blomia tropicalis]
MNTIERSLKKFTTRTEEFIVNKCTPTKINTPRRIHFDSKSSTSDDDDRDNTLNIDSKMEPLNKQESLYVISLSQQIRTKFLSKPFEFTLMVVGQSGLGKSTFINSLFPNISADETCTTESIVSCPETTSIQTSKYKLIENDVSVNLTIVDTPGFGDYINNSDCIDPIENFIDEKYEEYFIAESSIYPRNIIDQRVHCCLYFISPTGRAMKQIDINFMEKLHRKSPIIPLIAKADSLTKNDLSKFKQKILETMDSVGIQMYPFPDAPVDNSSLDQYRDLKSRIPFGVVGHDSFFEKDDQSIRCRQYPWGMVEIDNLDHCDTKAFSDLFIKHSLVDLISRTADFYENFRAKKLLE